MTCRVLFGTAVMPLPVREQLLRDSSFEGVAWVGVSEEGGEGDQDLGDGQGWAPLVLQNVQTNLPA